MHCSGLNCSWRSELSESYSLGWHSVPTLVTWVSQQLLFCSIPRVLFFALTRRGVESSISLKERK